MKKKGICLVLVMMLILGMVGSTALAAQRAGTVISTEIRSDLNKIVNVELERRINDSLSLYVAPYTGLGLGISLVGARAGGKYYLQGSAPEGLWIGGFGVVDYASLLWFSETTFGGGANAGYKYFITDRLTLEGNAGFVYVVGPGFELTWGVNVGMTL